MKKNGGQKSRDIIPLNSGFTQKLFFEKILLYILQVQ